MMIEPTDEDLKRIWDTYVEIENKLRGISDDLLKDYLPELVITAWGNVGNEMLSRHERMERGN